MTNPAADAPLPPTTNEMALLQMLHSLITATKAGAVTGLGVVVLGPGGSVRTTFHGQALADLNTGADLLKQSLLKTMTGAAARAPGVIPILTPR
jgi:hypothetical protein